MDTIQLSSLDHYFADFIVGIEPVQRDGLWIAAALASAVSCRGSVCLDLSAAAGYEIIPFKPESGEPVIPKFDCWLELLADCATVGKPGEYTPLVLDAAGQLYLHRSWDYECRVAEGVLVRSAPIPIDTPIYTAALDRYFPLKGDDGDLQREAAHAALSRRFTVISGGPGTGKTSTVARILALMVELAEDGPPLVLLAAPTGKAAMRLKQSISGSAELMMIPESVRSVMPKEVSTIHRLLGVIPGQSAFRHNQKNPLLCDVLVVDEASMIDLPLLARLLEALRPDARVILLGDRDQLASVESGSVFSDICAGSKREFIAAGTGPAFIQLTKSYRFNDKSGIGRLSRLINAGDGAEALALLKSGLYSDVSWCQLPPEGGFAEKLMETAKKGFSDYAQVNEPAAALDELDRFRILAPHREGRCGVVALNRLVEAALFQSRALVPAGIALLPVMITANNYDLGLYNGDTGVVDFASSVAGQTVFFPAVDSELRRFSAVRLPPHETAFALTVHKSQGSEFERVLLILPDQLSDILSRELLYTAVTRARKSLEIWGDEDVFCRAVERRIKRHSGLADRLVKEVQP